MAKAEIISDGWQVFLAWSGRGAEVILFICMAFSLVQAFPSIHVPDPLTGAVLVIQMITLDVAGFGLSSLANQVRRAGDEATADKAATVGTILICIMIISFLSVVINNLFGKLHLSLGGVSLSSVMTGIDYIMILARVVMTVLYGRIIHSLRDSQQQAQAQADETEAKLEQDLSEAQANQQKAEQSASQLTKQVTDLQKQLQEAKFSLLNNGDEQGKVILSLQQQVTHLTSQLQEKVQISSDLQSAKNTIARLQVAEQQAKSLAESVKGHEQIVKDLSEKLSQETRKCESLSVKLHNERVKAQGEKSVKAGVKASQNQPANITSIDQARAKSKTDEAAVLAYIQSSPDVKVPQVAEHFGVTTRTIYNILKRQQDGESDCEGEAVSQS